MNLKKRRGLVPIQMWHKPFSFSSLMYMGINAAKPIGCRKQAYRAIPHVIFFSSHLSLGFSASSG